MNHRSRECFLVVALVASPAVALAQSDTSRVLLPCNAGLELYRAQMYDLSYHAGWGATVGGVAGFLYGFAMTRGNVRGLATMAYTVVGGTAGLAAGAGVYLVRRARGRSAPSYPLCVPRRP